MSIHYNDTMHIYIYIYIYIHIYIHICTHIHTHIYFVRDTGSQRMADFISRRADLRRPPATDARAKPFSTVTITISSIIITITSVIPTIIISITTAKIPDGGPDHVPVLLYYDSMLCCFI